MAIFELGGALPEALASDLAVGPWRYAPRLVAFEVGLDEPAPVWRVALDRDAAAARAAFADAERSVARTHAVLDDVPRRLDRTLDHALAVRARPAVAGGRRPAPALPAESELVAALTRGAALPRWDVPAGSPGASRPSPSAPSAERDPGRLEQLLARVAELARGRARIETHVEGALVAHSTTTLSGDTELVTAPRLSLDAARMHARSVGVAVRTRHAWARVVTLIVSCCRRLVLFGLPAGGLAVLPMVWRFVRDALREVRRSAAPRPA